MKDERCLTYLLKSVILGSKSAIGIVGFILEFGIILKKDLSMAEKIYNRGVDCPMASLRLSFLKTYGRAGVIMDLPTAKRHADIAIKSQLTLNWLHYCATLGLAEAQFCLALAAHNGTGTPKCPISAFSWCEKAAIQGLSQAENLMGNLYCEGIAVETDFESAMEWYFQAASKAEPSAIYNIGTMFERGYGVQNSIFRAIEWYTRAARYGSTNAHNVLGILIEEGIIADEKEDAVDHYLTAASHGDSHAQYNLGRCYHDGFGCMKNDTVALRWFDRAAKQGHKLGLMSVGVCYELGIGTRRDLAIAVQYYKEAAEAGLEKARKRLFPIVVSRIQEVGAILLKPKSESKGVFSLPPEIRQSILSGLNIANVLTQAEMNEIFNGIHYNRQVQLLEAPKLFESEHKKVCSCLSDNCQRIMHVLSGIAQLQIK